MGVIVKPNIKVDSIEIKVDEFVPKEAEKLILEWGRYTPIIKIGDYVLSQGDLKDFSLKIALNSLPSFSMTIDDSRYIIREALKHDIDKCVIFLGYSDWYIKFNGILDKTYSKIGDTKIILNGTYFNDKLFEGKQFSYKDKTINEILKDICLKTSMGLFIYDNPDLNKKIDFSLITGIRYIDYLKNLISDYTDNIFIIDCHSYIHIGNIETIRKQKIDKYTLDWSSGEKILPQDIIFESPSKNPIDKNIIPISFFGVNTNFSEIHKETYNSYSLGYGGNGSVDIKSSNDIGIGSNKTNTFFGFKEHKNPYYVDRINKAIGGNNITITSTNILFELSPLSKIGLKVYLPFKDGADVRPDIQHSGEKIVIGYAINYKQKQGELNNLSQTIFLI